MIDPRRYDDAERQAMIQVGDWAALSSFRPYFFQESRFPIRIAELGELRYVVSVMNDVRDAEAVLREMRGLRAPDVDAIFEAVRRFVGFQVGILGHTQVVIPFTSFVYYYALFRKLKRLPGAASILDIGSGLGYLPFFIGDDPAIRAYDAIEVTQSLYVLQSAINSFVFGERQRDLAVGRFHPGAAVSADLLPRTTKINRVIELDFAAPARCTLFPWWRINEPFERKYDVVMCNENICEMDLSAFVFFAQKTLGCLTGNGLLFIHGIGKTVGDRHRLIDERLSILLRLGYRALAVETSFENKGRLSRPNLLMMAPGHERYGEGQTRTEDFGFDDEDPVLRSVYGLDEPAGEITDVEALKSELGRRLEPVGRVGPGHG